MSKEKISYLLLKLAVAFPLFYSAWSMYLRPKYWSAYFPEFLTDTIRPGVLLWIVSALLLIAGAWILFNRKPFFPSIAVTVYLGTIVFFNTKWGAPSFDIFYRDIAIALASLALAIKSKSM